MTSSVPSRLSSQYGYTNKTKWALIEFAPFTASGLNEILVTAETKLKIRLIAQLLEINPTFNGRYQIIRLPD